MKAYLQKMNAKIENFANAIKLVQSKISDNLDEKSIEEKVK